MDYNIEWLFLGVAAYILAVSNLVRVCFLKRQPSYGLLLCSMSLGALTILEEFQTVYYGLAFGDITGSEESLEVVKGIAETLTIGIWILIGVNLIPLIVQGIRKRITEKNSDSESKA